MNWRPSQETIDSLRWVPPDEIWNMVEGVDYHPMSANVFSGADNGNYGNPTDYHHSEEVKHKIKTNNAKYWSGKSGSRHPATGRPRPDAVESAKIARSYLIGKPSPKKGKKYSPHTEETKLKMSEIKKGIPKPKITCPHCGKEGGLPQMKQWHFDKCKDKK